MRTISYTFSPSVQQSIEAIENLRAKILLYPLSPVHELRLLWEANISRIYYSLHLSHNPVTHKEIVHVLLSSQKKTLSVREKEIVQYKQAFNFIQRDWLVNKKPVMPQTIQTLYRLVTGQRSKLADHDLMELLVFLQTSSENPFIQAFVSYIQFSQLVTTNDLSSKAARLLPYIFLYKAGYDFRSLLVLELYFYRNERLVRDMHQAMQHGETMTIWIEHFIQGIATELEEVYRRISQDQEVVGKQAIDLTDRQKDIMLTFDQPGVKITNKKVQEQFHVSQITASRDLAKLAALGLLFTNGKGRSVYYTRV